jgi:hypothetical protein
MPDFNVMTIFVLLKDHLASVSRMNFRGGAAGPGTRYLQS